MANTPLRSFRISDELYKAAKEQAESEGLTLSAVLVWLLEQYSGHQDNA
jgi:antitoxin component of RelBE/YafQ-DinJ toxin-antitoxin module